MRPQILDLNSEVLEEFRNKFNFALSSLIRNMIEKDLNCGEVGGKVVIEINRTTDKETGEILLMPVIKPDVHLKIKAKGKLECSTVGDMILKKTPCGDPVVASNQISFDEMMELERKEGA